jgi:hypothetical protein
MVLFPLFGRSETTRLLSSLVEVTTDLSASLDSKTVYREAEIVWYFYEVSMFCIRSHIFNAPRMRQRTTHKRGAVACRKGV